MPKAMPKTLYAKIEDDKDASYFVADTDPDALVEMAQTVRIGVYQLVEVKDAKGVAQFSGTRRR